LGRHSTSLPPIASTPSPPNRVRTCGRNSRPRRTRWWTWRSWFRISCRWKTCRFNSRMQAW